MQQQQQHQQRRLQQQLGEWGNLAAVYLLIVVAASTAAAVAGCLEALEAKQSHKLGRRLFQSKILITAKMLQHSQSALKTETQTHNVAALSTHFGDCSFYSHSTGILRSHYQEQQQEQEQAKAQAQAQLNATIDMAH